MESKRCREVPRWSFAASSVAERERAIEAKLTWQNRLESIGLGESDSGDLPGFHFVRESGGAIKDGFSLTAFWASGGGGIRAVVRNWAPEKMTFDLDIVEESDGLTWRIYE